MSELLAPAGSQESLIAAVQNGADAVYMGFGDFNARRNAKNFGKEEFLAAVRYCHLRGVKVYLTLNTLLFDRELPAAAETIATANAIGVDAVLVQDWGILELIRSIAPDLPVHASTQMSICNLDGAREAARLGMTRVVLAREMDKDGIAQVCAKSGIETEVFVHGAHCMSYSGQCAMSALIGGRSGNRGTCAQPCRLPYGLNAPCKRGYPMSLKDLSLAEHIPELTAMGVTSFKLEGRMKRAEYVAVITNIFSKLLGENRVPTKQEWIALYNAFSRNGFTDGFYMHNKGPVMMGTRTEGTAEPKELFEAARKTYENTEHCAIRVEMNIRILRGKKAELTVLDYSGNRADVEGSIPEDAISRPLDPLDIAQRLKKTGGTAFTCENVHVELDENLSLPVSAINALRREALEQLTDLRIAAPERRAIPYAGEKIDKRGADFPLLTVSVARAEQITPRILSAEPARIYVPLELFDQLDTTQILKHATQLCAVLPRIYFQNESEKLYAMLERAKEKGATLLAIGNLGHLRLVNGIGLPLCGDFGLNITNSASAAFWRKEGLTSATVSFELRNEQIRDMDKSLPLEAIVYGRLPLMLTETCFVSNANRGTCNSGCNGSNFLADRTGAQFPLLPAYGCRNEVENSKTLFLADKEEYKNIGLTFARLRFTTETPEECARIMDRYCGNGDFIPDDFTRGLFYRSVE